MSTDLTLLTASQAAARIAAGDLTSEAYTRAFLDRIDERDPLIRAFVWVDRQAVLAAARERDRGPWRGPLHGLPIAVKDVINTRDAPTQHNSPVYEGHRPAEDANCVGVLRGAGALMLGKTDTAEFASAGRQPVARNPRRPTHTPGGSSSGSAAAVADRMAPLALGTQTGGSTIRPASFCGVHAMKPTFRWFSSVYFIALFLLYNTITNFLMLNYFREPNHGQLKIPSHMSLHSRTRLPCKSMYPTLQE